MSVKTILVPLTGVSGRSHALDAGLRLARRLDAHAEVLHVALDPRESVAFLGEGMTGAMIEEIMAVTEREAEERRARARKLFDEQCAGMKIPVHEQGVRDVGPVSASFLHVVGREEQQVAARGRLVDLIVIDQPVRVEEVASQATLEAALRETGRPVLVVPAGEHEVIGESIAIAWNGSVEASRAVAGALPFLVGAGRVVIFSIGEDGAEGAAADDVVTYLAWHGVSAGGEAIDAGPRSVGTDLLAAASASRVDLLVMGAYTHSRLHRLIFGGATREVLASAQIPVLMAH